MSRTNLLTRTLTNTFVAVITQAAMWLTDQKPDLCVILYTLSP